MKYEFTSHADASVIYTQEIPDDMEPMLRCKVALSLAVWGDANLAGANLAGAYLPGANLAGANLEGVSLSGAMLANANLRGANLGGANLEGANLAGANLICAYLEGANFEGTILEDVNFEDVELTNLADAIKIAQEDIPVIPHIDATILRAIEAGGELDMGAWHGSTGYWCGTEHCRAGWAIHEAGKKGKALEDRVGSHIAGAMIYRASRPGQPAPWFFAPNDVALEDLRKCAAEDPLP